MSFEESVVLPALKPGTAFSAGCTEPTLPSLTSPSLVRALAAVAEAVLRPWWR